jgi:hypothetical protein
MLSTRALARGRRRSRERGAVCSEARDHARRRTRPQCCGKAEARSTISLEPGASVNVRRLCCRADRAPGAAPTVFALGFKRLRRARGPRPGQYQPLVVAHRIFQGTAWYRRNEWRMRSEPGRSRGVLSRGF